MKYFTRFFTGCVICFIGVMAGLQFAKGNIGWGVFDLFLAASNLPHLILND